MVCWDVVFLESQTHLLLISCFSPSLSYSFAAWLSVLFSAAALGLTATAFKSTVRGMGALTGLLCCAIIVIIAIVPWIGQDSFYRYEAIYAMCVSVATIVLVLAVIVRQKMTDGKSARGCEGIFAFVVLCLFAILWVALAAVCTFRGPFLNTGNGKSEDLLSGFVIVSITS